MLSLKAEENLVNTTRIPGQLADLTHHSMSATPSGRSHLANPLATPEQLVQSASQLHGVPRELEDAVRFHACSLIQAAGILLRRPQQTIAETVVIFTRFWLGPTGGSLFEFNAQVSGLPPHRLDIGRY